MSRFPKRAKPRRTIRPQACEACPYRRDVPSGVWSADDYMKLPPYDAETGEQPMEPFACHAAPQTYCHGWAVCHGHNLLSLRLRGMANDIPPPSTPLFATAREAALHGIRDIEKPKVAARRMMARLLGKYRRLRKELEPIPSTKRKTTRTK